MECTIFYESWQMQCCGTEFKIGDVIEWIVCTSENFTPANINIDYFYEAHSNKWKTLFVLSGTISEIQLFYQKYIPSPNNKRFLIPSHQFIIENVENIDGWEENKNDMEFSGYIVKINNYCVRNAKKQDITYI